MKDDDSHPLAISTPTHVTTAPPSSISKSDSTLFSRGRYKFLAFAAILLLAFWSVITGTVTLRWSAENLNRLSESLRRTLSQRRPWYELVDRIGFSRPDSLTEATSRVRKNLSYFRVYYLTLLAAVLAFPLLSHPFSLQLPYPR